MIENVFVVKLGIAAHGRAGGLQVARHGATRRGARRGRLARAASSSKRPGEPGVEAPERASLGPPGVRADGDLDQAAQAETEALKGERPGDDRCAAGDDRRATTRPLAWEYAGTLVQFGLFVVTGPATIFGRW